MTLNFRAQKATSSIFVSTLAPAFALSISILPGLAADFSHAQKVVVPASSYDRRIDFSSIREQYTKSGGKAAPAKSQKPAAHSPAHTTHSTGHTATHSPAHTAEPSTSEPSATAKSATAHTAIHNTTSHSAKAPASHKTASAAKKPSAFKSETPMMDTSYAKATTSGSPVKTVVPSDVPPPHLNGKLANGRSLSDFAKSLSSKIPPGALAKMKAQAVEFEKSGRLDDAQRVLTKIAQMSPQDKANLQQVATVSVLRAKNYLKSNNLPEALLAARQALAASPADPEASSVLSQLYRKVGVDPNDVRSRLQTAHNLYSQSRYQEAEVEYKASLAVKPTADAHIGLGRVAQKMQGDAAGKQHFEHALEIDSNHAGAHRELGVHHLKSGDVVSANSELSRALILDPKDKDAGQHLVKLWQGQVSKLPNANSHLGLARAYQLNGDLSSAQAEYREVVRIDPNHPHLPAARQSFKIALARQEAEKAVTAAKSLELQGLVTEAVQKMNEAVAYSPGNSGYKIYQGELLEKLGQPNDAKQVYLNVLKDDPQNLSAVQKIKKLGNVAANVGSAGLGIAGALLPGGANPRQPAGFPGTKFPMDMTADASMLSPGGAPPPDHVAQLGGFMTEIRNHMLTSNVANKKFEDAASKVIKQLTDPDPEPAAKASGAGGGAESDDDIVKKILASPSPKAEVGAAVGGGAEAAIANAKAALDAIKGSGSSAKPSGSASPAPSLSSSKGISDLPPKTSAVAAGKSSKNQRLQDLENQNKALQAQLAQLKAQATTSSQMPPAAPSLPPAAPEMQSVPYGTPQPYGTPEPYGTAQPYGAAQSVPAAAPPVAPGNAIFPSEFAFPGQDMAPPAAPSLPVGPLSAAPAQFGMQNAQMPQMAMMPQSAEQLQLRGPITSSAPIKFELKNIRPGLRDVSLKVSLRNDSNEALVIPPGLQAIVKYPNQTEAEMKIAFDAKAVAPHSTVDGVVKVPFSKVDPNADLVLRNLLPTNEELHIIKTAVSLSQ